MTATVVTTSAAKSKKKNIRWIQLPVCLFACSLLNSKNQLVKVDHCVFSPPYTRTPLDASIRGPKKRKQGEDNALISHLAACSV